MLNNHQIITMLRDTMDAVSPMIDEQGLARHQNSIWTREQFNVLSAKLKALDIPDEHYYWFGHKDGREGKAKDGSYFYGGEWLDLLPLESAFIG